MSYHQIALDLGGARGDRLTYSSPQSDKLGVGSLVLVSVRGRRSLGVVLGDVEPPEFKTHDIDGLASSVSLPPSHLELATWMSKHYRARLFECLRLCLPPGLESRLKRDSGAGLFWPPRPDDIDRSRSAAARVFLSRDQRDACDAVTSGIRSRQPHVFLLHGVTGSGKTHVFLEAADEALRLGTQVLVLVSDISLTPELVRRIEQRFPGDVGVFHSSIAEGARARTWRAIHDGQIKVVVGTRSALFAPAHQLGLVVIDEEHEPSYKQEASRVLDALFHASSFLELHRLPELFCGFRRHATDSPTLYPLWRLHRP